MVRAQYFSRQSNRGLLAWDVRRLIDLSRDLPVEQLNISEIAEIDEAHWYACEGDSPTCRSLLGHMQLIDKADLTYPIIIDPEGRVMDGMHRVCKAIREGLDTVPAVRFAALPEPDYIDCVISELPYDD